MLRFARNIHNDGGNCEALAKGPWQSITEVEPKPGNERGIAWKDHKQERVDRKLLLGKSSAFLALSWVLSEICAGRLCRGRGRRSPSKSERGAVTGDSARCPAPPTHRFRKRQAISIVDIVRRGSAVAISVRPRSSLSPLEGIETNFGGCPRF